MEENITIPQEEEIVLTPESVQEEIKKTRHNKELILYVLCAVLGCISLLTMLSFYSRSSVYFVLSLISGIMMFLFTMIIAIVQLYGIYSQNMSYSVKVSENNFPEIYEKVKEYSYLLGLKKEPEVYVRQNNGTVNAYSAWIPGKTFIQLNAEIVDIAYMEHQDLNTVLFVLGHEMGHIYLHHVQIYYNILAIIVSFVPVIGPLILFPMLSRAREYSCDRVAQALTNYENDLDCMMMLSAGRHLYKYIEADKYLEDINSNHGFVERLFRWLINFHSTHPIMPFRTQAVIDPEKKSGRLI